MELTVCPDCKRAVSTEAKYCWNCSFELKPDAEDDGGVADERPLGAALGIKVNGRWISPPLED